MSFIHDFISNGNISFSGMREVAVTSLRQYSEIKRKKLYDDLDRGKGVLDDDDHLNMYLWSFGLMHKEKMNEVFRCLPNLINVQEDIDFEIYDWGCGQGTATICLLDYITSKNHNFRVNRINLIEPSKAATKRAKAVIECYKIAEDCDIHIVNKAFDDISNEDIKPKYPNRIHLFSNILDVTYFDLANFTNQFQRAFCSGSNHFVCVGPLYCNNYRIIEFMTAIDPDAVIASFDKQAGQWKKDWTISLRMFSKSFSEVEEVAAIRKRIVEAKKHQQYHAGFILDEVSEAFKLLDDQAHNIAEKLLNALCAFDVRSNESLEIPEDADSKWVVMNNLLVRGNPTIAPLELEEEFFKAFGKSIKPEKGDPAIWYKNNGINPYVAFEALHVIDPRFSINNYNGDMLESDFEKTFIEKRLNGSQSEYLIQLLEPQRPLSSIVSIPDRRFTRDQRVDFALELPCSEDENNPVGFVIEIDGSPFHSNILQRRKDERRDRFASKNQWDTYRLTESSDNSFVENWERENSLISYLNKVKANYRKTINGDWSTYLQFVLTPLAVARIEKLIIESVLTGKLKTTDEQWNIAVIERDVPCAAIAIKHLQEVYEHLCLLKGDDKRFPKVNLEISSTEEFRTSPLHGKCSVHTSLPKKKYDICIDISMLLRDNIDALPNPTDADVHYIVRTSHYKKRDRVIYTAKSINYLPLVEKGNRGEYTELETPKKYLTYFLQNIFRKRAFRKGQLPILSRALSNKTTIGLLPTGGGKSLVYQMSAIMQPGVTLVVDPLISLMVDQYRSLLDIRIDASACVNSTMDVTTKNKNLSMMQNGSLLFIFLSPERFMMENFREHLLTMARRNKVYFSYGVIDEVHCVSEWGHDFRTSYLHLGRNMIKFMLSKSGDPIPVIGLTATASFDVLADVERELTLGGNLTLDSEAIVRPENETRPELTYKIIGVETEIDEIRDPNNPYLLKADSEWPIRGEVAKCKKKAILDLLEDIPNDLDKVNEKSKPSECIPDFSIDHFYSPDENGKFPNAGIIFCPHARGDLGVEDTRSGSTTGIASYLIADENERLSVGTFIGGDKPTGDMARFQNDEQNVMVATKAFGMGIDKPNVRYTININHPSSIESYVQEAGRAGRDRKNAISYLLYDSTEYIYLSMDKINDINVQCLHSSSWVTWLYDCKNRYVLREDFVNLLISSGATEDDATLVRDYCIEKDYFENVDKNIQLWFHNNSFRGLYKERIILYEMTDRILNTKPQNIMSIQAQLRDELGNEDVTLLLKRNKNALVVASEEDNSQQYGYLFLDSLTPTFKYVNFDISICQKVLDTLIGILKPLDDHTSDWLARPIQDVDVEDVGIYSAMKNVRNSDYLYVTVTWENLIYQDRDEFERSIKTAISKIAEREEWNDIDEGHYGPLKLDKINSFEELITKISKCSNDIRWVQHLAHENKFLDLKKAFSKKRDKDDTDKAIYRMCCVGLVDDVTIDYNLQTYQLKIKKRTDDEYLQCMLDFFKKYYSTEQAETKVEEIKRQKGRNIIDKCLGYLAEFVYQNLERKRFRSIDDMRLACEDGLVRGEEWLKEFIHLYFNSKYARDDYRIDDKDYSLKSDTDRNREDYGVVRKYIEAISIDNSGSEVDNAKHLYGATLLVLRAHPENAALNLLRTFCITFLGSGENETLKREALTGYVDAFVRLHNDLKVSIDELNNLIDEFNNELSKYVHVDDDFIMSEIIDKAKDIVMVNIQNSWLDNFKKNYCK